MHALLCGQVLFSNLTLSELVVMGGGGGGGGRRGRGRGRGRGYDGLGPYGVVAGVFTCDAFILMGLLGLLRIRCRSGLTRAPRGNEDHINTEVIADSNAMGHGDPGGTREDALEHSGIVRPHPKIYKPLLKRRLHPNIYEHTAGTGRIRTSTSTQPDTTASENI